MLRRFLFEKAELTNTRANPSFFLEDVPGVDLISESEPGKELDFEG